MCINTPVGWGPLRIHTQFYGHPLPVCSAANGPRYSWQQMTARAHGAHVRNVY